MLTTITFAIEAAAIVGLLPLAKELVVLGIMKLEDAIFEEVEA